jgi:hypothetical protein
MIALQPWAHKSINLDNNSPNHKAIVTRPDSQSLLLYRAHKREVKDTSPALSSSEYPHMPISQADGRN